MSSTAPEVLIVGAGPTGLSAALLLGRAGVQTHVVARHPGTATHPKAHVVNARTMELLRQWGLNERVHEAALPPERGLGMAWMTRMTGPELGRIMVDDDPALLEAMLTHSSEILRSCPQDVLEPLLLAAARAYDGVSIAFGTEMTALSQDATGVCTRVRSVADGTETTIRSAYVIGADGAHSAVRHHAGIPLSSQHPVGHMMGAHFTADLTAYQRERPYLLWWIVNADAQGALIALDGERRWTYLFGYDPERERPEDFTPERCAGLVRHAVGAADVPVAVHSVSPWQIEISLADRFREGRVFLAGDAAHRFPPTGGFGMNTGIQDAHNLAWKLAHVLRGTAGDALLDTYEEERRPVAHANAEQSMLNAKRMSATGALLSDPAALREVEDEGSPKGADLRARIAAAIPEQREQVFFLGQTFGYVYASAAVVGDGTPAPQSSVAVYRPTAHPGARAPHVWLRHGSSGEQTALLDLIADRFALLTGPEGQAWQEAVPELNRSHGLDVTALCIGPEQAWTDDTGWWQPLYGIGPSGCVLVRPDGHVALRSPAATDDPQSVLASALDRVLARSTPGPATEHSV